MAKIDKIMLISLYYDMLRIRMVEEKIADLYKEQEMRCPVHLCIGQEAVSVGVCANLLREDYVLSNHRSHGHYLAKGGNLKAMLSEIYGKWTGCSKGKGGSMHLIDLSVNFLGATPIVGGIIPVAVGVAFGTIMRGDGKEDDRITTVFLGDAATEEGVFCESLNFAALKKLPIIFVCENNFFSVYSPLSVRQPKERCNISLASSYGIGSAKGDGNNVLDVYRLTEKAVSHIKEGLGPFYLEFDTYRWREHCGPNYDNDLGYRDESEFFKWQERCPVEAYEKSLVDDGIINREQINEFKREIRSEIEEAIAYARSSPFPDTYEVFTDLYAGDDLCQERLVMPRLF